MNDGQREGAARAGSGAGADFVAGGGDRGSEVDPAARPVLDGGAAEGTGPSASAAGSSTVAPAAVVAALRANWAAERESAATYRHLAEVAGPGRRRDVLLRLADAEERHAERWAARLADLGAAPPAASAARVPLATRVRARVGFDAVIDRIEAVEEAHQRHYQDEAARFDPQSAALGREIAREEAGHARTLRAVRAGGTALAALSGDPGLGAGGGAHGAHAGGAHGTGAPGALGPRDRLDAILGRERHVRSGSWIGDAIYGANDGLGAIFGLIAGVAGAHVASHTILITGVAGSVAAAVSMGSGAFLAAKSQIEVHDAELAREGREIDEDPEEEREELSLFYQLKGMEPEAADRLAETVSADREGFLQALAQEELGLDGERLPRPWIAMASSSLSTAVGALVPVVPFFFLSGTPAVVLAAIVSLLGHFAVGAAKSLVTIRTWWASGLEMTWIGVIVGVITYLVGAAFGAFA